MVMITSEGIDANTHFNINPVSGQNGILTPVILTFLLVPEGSILVILVCFIFTGLKTSATLIFFAIEKTSSQ